MLPAKQRESLRKSGKRILGLLADGLTPRRIVTQLSLMNAAVVGMVIGGSTNMTLHIPAITHEAGLTFSLENFDIIRRSVWNPQLM